MSTCRFERFAKPLTACSRSQHEQSNDELDEHAHNDRMPFDRFPILRSGPHDKNDNGQAKKRHGTISTVVIHTFRASESPNHEDTDDDCRTQRDLELFWDESCEFDPSVAPYPMHGFGNDGNWDVEEEQAEGHKEPDEKSFEPSCSSSYRIMKSALSSMDN